MRLQVNPMKNIGRRLSFYKSKLIVEQIGKSENYNKIQRVICVCILCYDLFTENKDYMNNFSAFCV